MSTLTITLEDSEARLLELAARKEHQPVEAWARVRLRRAAGDLLQNGEEPAARFAPSPEWLALFGAWSGDDSITLPARSPVREIPSLD